MRFKRPQVRYADTPLAEGLRRECGMVRFAHCGIERQDAEGSLLCQNHTR